MQKGSHPAPMFKAAAPVKPAAVAESLPAACRVRGRAAAPATPAKAAAPAAPRTPGEIINDIQRELARRGYYEGAVDGLYGPRTDGAIRDFEHASGLKPSTEPNEALLQAIVRSPARMAKATTTGATPVPRPPLPVRNDVAAERPAPSRSASSRCSARSPNTATGRSSRPGWSTPRRRPRSKNLSASASCRSPARLPTGSRASLRR